MKFKLFPLFILFLPAIAFTQKINGSAKQGKAIMANIRQFSADYVAGNYAAVVNAYTTDGKIMPPGPPIITGHDELLKRWTMPEGSKMLAHAISPEEITILGKTAYDFGYYEGESQNAEGERTPFKGKYVIVWKKVAGEWKIYLDIWNPVRQ